MHNCLSDWKWVGYLNVPRTNGRSQWQSPRERISITTKTKPTPKSSLPPSGCLSAWG